MSGTLAMEQRRATILCAQIVGYGRLSNRDEAGTKKTLSAYLEIWTEIVRRHQGRFVKHAGEKLLAEMSTAHDALACAVEAQRIFKERNSGLPVDRRLRFRIGLNAGPTIVEHNDIYGEAVDIAARLADQADAGGVCVSQVIITEGNTRLGLHFEPSGEIRAKQITEPIIAYRVKLEADGTGQRSRRRPPSIVGSIGAAVTVVIGMIVAAAVLSTWIQPTGPDVEPAAGPVKPMPLLEKPSIAVLPFENHASDPAKVQFASGLTDAVVNSLSKFSDLAVALAHPKPNTAHETHDDMQGLGKELDVRYVLRGTVRQSGGRVRVIVQLFDTTDGTYAWGGRYDVAESEVLATENGVIGSIAAGIWTQVTRSGDTRVLRSETSSAEAYRLAVLGFEHYRRFTPTDNAEAKYYFTMAATLDPEFLASWSALGWSYFNEARYGWSETPKESLARASKLAEKVLSIDPSNVEARALLDRIQANDGHVDQIAS